MFDDLIEKPKKWGRAGSENLIEYVYNGPQHDQKVVINYKNKTVKFHGGWDLQEFQDICKKICEDLGETAPFEYTPHNDWYILKPDFSALNAKILEFNYTFNWGR